jgi:hypothetical protein
MQRPDLANLCDLKDLEGICVPLLQRTIRANRDLKEFRNRFQ